MADYPDTRRTMLRAGYTLIYTRPCAKCRMPVDRYRTARGKEITMDRGADDNAKVQAHLKTCIVALREQAERDDQGEPLYKFAARSRAQAIVMVKNGEFSFEVDNLCDPADMHITLSNAADAVRDYLVRAIQQEPL